MVNISFARRGGEGNWALPIHESVDVVRIDSLRFAPRA
jgi:hypothetical protein